MDSDDRRLLEAIQKGDGESFGVLYDRTRGFLLFAVILPRVGRGAAEDVLSETYRTALDKIRDFEWKGVGLLNWLAAIARRKALERVRRHAVDAARQEPLPDLFDVPDGAATAEAEMIRVEALAKTRERVDAALGKIPERYARALRLRLLEGRPRPECAELLSVSPATFDVVLLRATRAFRKQWSAP